MDTKNLLENESMQIVDDIRDENDQEDLIPAPPVSGKRKKTGILSTVFFTGSWDKTALSAVIALISVLCMIEAILLGINIGTHYEDCLRMFEDAAYVPLGVTLVSVIFCLILFGCAVKSLVRLLRQKQEIRLEAAATLVAFYAFRLFAEDLCADQNLLISTASFLPVLIAVSVLLLLYGGIRIRRADFSARICAFSVSCVCIGCIFVMFFCSAGDFAAVSGIGGSEVRLSELNIVQYTVSVLEEGKGSNAEALFLQMGNQLDLSSTYLEEYYLIIPLQYVVLFCANVLPYAAFSLLGYLVYGLISSDYVQYYQLNQLRKVSILSLILSVASGVSLFVMQMLFSKQEVPLTFQMDYQNIGITVGMYVLLIVLSALPWKLYHKAYENTYRVLYPKEGDK